ncbi:M56 family metallopeptidase [Gulosibacter molinativorax]|uniref:M56 family peptidase n=1 Tax=Gulosibacter molinativorax TaxID=256821 RepID=A0ABT7C8Y0_9MICO|nr:M56 family metallopeptidase [Gulosibacter molinativorax]MDJ1371620.1 M56 family peptidase [Gulosibacter molinativorax]QUY61037.1 Heat shock protein [Gulosibacter molinativorax]
MLALSFGLASLAVALAWPVPISLAGAKWTRRSPVFTLVLWQAIALAGGFSMISSLLLFGLRSFGDSLSGAAANFLARTFDGRLWVGDFPAGFGILDALALCFAAMLFAHLILNLAVTTTRTVRQHHRHRQLIELLSTPVPGRRHTHQIAVDAPFAYCLPGLMSDMTIVSEGLVRRLSPGQLGAVIAHEEAHLTQKHTVVLTVFEAWASALPWFPIASRAQASVAVLIEMLADDLALRSVSRDDLVAAIRVTALGQQDAPGAPVGAVMSASVPAPRAGWFRRTFDFLWGSAVPKTNPVEARVRRLLDAPRPLSIPARVSAIAGSGLLLVLPPLAIF